MSPFFAPKHPLLIAARDAVDVTESAFSACEAGSESVVLSQLVAGTLAVVTAITAAAAEISRLMAMGVCLGQTIEIIQPGDPLILRVLGTRVGVSARLAREVTVSVCGPLPEDAASSPGDEA